jgi:thiosulfate/3-mercaptopyruvate sulfurtransferase
MAMAGWRTLISVQDLRDHLGEDGWVVVDCRFDLKAPKAGEEAYRLAHVPGAVYAHLERDLSGPRTATTGRHPLPEPAVLAACLGGWGIGAEIQVVAYDAGAGVFASRLWWLLRWLGHERVAVLDGGLSAWSAGGHPISTADFMPRRGEFRPVTMVNAVVESDSISSKMESRDSLLIDARAGERFRGEVEPIDPVAGHVPGARNVPFERNLDSHGRFLSPDALHEAWLRRLAGQSPEAVVHMCGSGVTACVNLLAMEHAGLRGSRLYAGSWSEWITDPARPVAIGEE